MTASYNLSLLGSNYLQGGSGSVARTTASKLQESVSVLDFGAAGDGVTDDTAAIQAALNFALLRGGGNIFFPSGVYICNGQLSLTTPIDVNLHGEGNDNTNSAGSRIRYTGTASPFFSFNTPNARMFTMEKLDFQYSNAAFSGTLLKMPGFDMCIRKCHLSGYGGALNALYLLDINESVDVHLDQVRFGASQYGLHGMSSTGYANAVVLNQCAFSGPLVANVLNTGQGWVVNGCSFEPCANNLANGIYIEPAAHAQGLTINGCWFGDLTDTALSPANQWITFNGEGLFMSGNYCNGGGFHSACAVRINGTTKGINITGNHFAAFNTMLAMGTGYCSDVVVLGNSYSASCDAFVTGTLASGTLICPEWVFAVPGDIKITGGLSLTNTLNAKGTGVALASSTASTLVKGEFVDVAAGAKFGELVQAKSASAGVWHQGLYAVRGTFASIMGWVFSSQDGTNVEKDTFSINYTDVSPVPDNVVTSGTAAARWSKTFTGNAVLSTAAVSNGAGTMTVGSTTATTVGAAGGASALPATPLGYIIGYVGTTQVKIPYYNA